MSRKILSIVLMIALTMSLAGCGKKEEPKETEGFKEIEVTEAAQETKESAVAEEPEEEEEPAWYELSAEDTILTVRLSANATTGYEWIYSIDDEDILEGVTDEYIPADSNGMVGTGGIWVGSFKATGEAAGEAMLKLEYKRNWEEDSVKKKILSVLVNEDGKLIITGVSETEL